MFRRLLLVALVRQSSCLHTLELDWIGHASHLAPSGMGGASCANTVSYLFITRESLPFDGVWSEYFKGCPDGSYNVHVHSQLMGSTGKLHEARLLQTPVQGELRFNYNMVQTMLELFRQASISVTPNGCRPQRAMLLSGSCAPLRQCTDFHSFLQASPGTSLIRYQELFSRDAPIFKSRRPAKWDGWLYKQSQWSALWMEHVDYLLANEKKNKEIWKDAYCPDEHYVVNVLMASKKNITNHTVTHVSFPEEGSLKHAYRSIFKNGHPDKIKCPGEGGNDGRAFNDIENAVAKENFFFARKFDKSCVRFLEDYTVRTRQKTAN